MDKILEVLAIVAFVIFIVYNIVEIVLANRLYKKIEKEHQDFIDKLIDKTVDDLLGEKNDSNV